MPLIFRCWFNSIIVKPCGCAKTYIVTINGCTVQLTSLNLTTPSNSVKYTTTSHSFPLQTNPHLQTIANCTSIRKTGKYLMTSIKKWVRRWQNFVATNNTYNWLSVMDNKNIKDIPNIPYWPMPVATHPLILTMIIHPFPYNYRHTNPSLFTCRNIHTFHLTCRTHATLLYG